MNWPQGSPSPHSHFASVQVSFPCGVLAWPTFWSMHWHLPVQGAAARPMLRLAAGQVAFSTTVQNGAEGGEAQTIASPDRFQATSGDFPQPKRNDSVGLTDARVRGLDGVVVEVLAGGGG